MQNIIRKEINQIREIKQFYSDSLSISQEVEMNQDEKLNGNLLENVNLIKDFVNINVLPSYQKGAVIFVEEQIENQAPENKYFLLASQEVNILYKNYLLMNIDNEVLMDEINPEAIATINYSLTNPNDKIFQLYNYIQNYTTNNQIGNKTIKLQAYILFDYENNNQNIYLINQQYNFLKINDISIDDTINLVNLKDLNEKQFQNLTNIKKHNILNKRLIDFMSTKSLSDFELNQFAKEAFIFNLNTTNTTQQIIDSLEKQCTIFETNNLRPLANFILNLYYEANLSTAPDLKQELTNFVGGNKELIETLIFSTNMNKVKQMQVDDSEKIKAYKYDFPLQKIKPLISNIQKTITVNISNYYNKIVMVKDLSQLLPALEQIIDNMNSDDLAIIVNSINNFAVYKPELVLALILNPFTFRLKVESEHCGYSKLFKITLQNVINNVHYTINLKSRKSMLNYFLQNLEKYDLAILIQLLNTAIFNDVKVTLPDQTEVTAKEASNILTTIFNLPTKEKILASILPLLNIEAINKSLNKDNNSYTTLILIKYLEFFSENKQNIIIDNIINNYSFLNKIITPKFNILNINSTAMKKILNYNHGETIEQFFLFIESFKQEEQKKNYLYFNFWHHNNQYLTPEIQQKIINHLTRIDEKIIDFLLFNISINFGDPLFMDDIHGQLGPTDLKVKIINSLDNERIKQIFSNPRFNLYTEEQYGKFSLSLDNFICKNPVVLRLITNDKLSIILNQLAEQNIYLIIAALHNQTLKDSVPLTQEDIYNHYILEEIYQDVLFEDKIHDQKKLLSNLIFNILSEANIINIIKHSSFLFHDLTNKYFTDSKTIFMTISDNKNILSFFLFTNLNYIEDLNKKNNILKYIATNQEQKSLLEHCLINGINYPCKDNFFNNYLLPLISNKRMLNILIEDDWFIEVILKNYLNSEINQNTNDDSFDYFNQDMNYLENMTLFQLNKENNILRNRIFPLILNDTSLLFKIMLMENNHPKQEMNINNGKSFFKLLAPEEINIVRKNFTRQLVKYEETFSLLSERYLSIILNNFKERTLVEFDLCFDENGF